MNRETPMSTPTDTSSARPFSQGKLIVAAVLATVVGAFFYFDLDRYLTFENLKANRDSLLAYTESHYVTSVALFIVTYCVVVALSLPGAAIMTMTGGFLFGSLVGTIYVNIGATTGATLAFLVARYLLHDWVEARFGHKLNSIQKGISKNAFSYLLTARLIPFVPFFVINFVSGLTRVTLVTYVTATAIGIIPASFVFAYAGRQLATINSPKEVLSSHVLLAFGLLILLALVPILYQKVPILYQKVLILYQEWKAKKMGAPS